MSGAKLDATNGGIVEVSGPVGIILSGSATLTSGGVYQGVSGASASLSAGDIDITMDNDGGQMLLDSAMSAHTTRTLNVTGCGVQLLRGCIPPVLNVTGGATATIGGSINLAGQADVRVNSSVPVQVGGDFNNQLTSPGSFDWNSGALRLTGSGPGYFELAGQNVGPRCPAGFTNNFSMGTVELALLSDIEFRDTFDNAAGAGCEALYITQLTLQPGSTIRINGCRVYFVNLTPGGNVIITNGGALMQTTDADMNGDTLVNGLDISLFVKVLLGQPGNVSAADMNGDGLANSLDIPLFLDVLTTSCPP